MIINSFDNANNEYRKYVNIAKELAMTPGEDGLEA